MRSFRLKSRRRIGIQISPTAETKSVTSASGGFQRAAEVPIIFGVQFAEVRRRLRIFRIKGYLELAGFWRPHPEIGLLVAVVFRANGISTLSRYCHVFASSRCRFSATAICLFLGEYQRLNASTEKTFPSFEHGFAGSDLTKQTDGDRGRPSACGSEAWPAAGEKHSTASVSVCDAGAFDGVADGSRAPLGNEIDRDRNSAPEMFGARSR